MAELMNKHTLETALKALDEVGKIDPDYRFVDLAATLLRAALEDTKTKEPA